MIDRAQTETRVLLLAPTAKDASASIALMTNGGLNSTACHSVAEVCDLLNAGAGAIVVPEEAVMSSPGQQLRRALRDQPPWSNLPVIVLTAAGPDSAVKVRTILELGDVTLLKRPLEGEAFLNALRAALRDRERQYQVRDYLAERQTVAEQLQAKDERLRFALTAGRLGSWEWDITTGGMECSVICKANYGRSPDNLFNYEDLQKAIHPDERARVLEAFDRTLSGNDELNIEYRVVWPDESIHWILVRGRLTSPERMSGISLDVTERKQAEEELRAREERFRALVTATSEVVYRMNPDWTEMRELVGREFVADTHEVNRFWMDKYIPPEDQPEVSTAVAEAIRSRSKFELEHRIIRIDGTYGWTFSRAIPLFDTRGNVTEWFGAANDITARKQLEQELRDADRKKDDFIALLAHELRNPLAPIRNGLEVMRLAGGDVNAVATARAMMDRQLSHMVRLVDDLLDVSRISRNKMELRRERVLLADAVNAAVETARPSIEAGRHDLQVSLPSGPVFLKADLTRLSQVFSNLLTNSAKYTKAGGRISLVAERDSDEVVVAVKDNGIGIPAESLGSVFEMFAQVDRNMERTTGGLGIGLALVKGLVEMHGGTVSVQSEGQGSTFTVRLPIAQGNEKSPSQKISNYGRDNRRVLVVDDNRDGAKSLAMMLELLGDDVCTAHDGVEAIEKAEIFQPEVILMDLGMPRLNGLDAAKQIRQKDWGKNIAIIALTGWGQDGDKERSREAGCDGHLVKPVNLPDLQNALDKVGV